LSAEHSRTRPYSASSSKKRSQALTMVEMGVKLKQNQAMVTRDAFVTYHSVETASSIACGTMDVCTMPAGSAIFLLMKRY
jgi:hypothetical protein